MLSLSSFERILIMALLCMPVITIAPDKTRAEQETVSILSVVNKSKYQKKHTDFKQQVIVTANPPSATIPFSRAGNLILLKAKADETEGVFILDTGAPGLILNMTYFRSYPLTETDGRDINGGITGSLSSAPTIVKNLSLASINYYKVEADRINLGHIENSKGVKILGLLGMQLFRQFEMIIDYETNLIHLHHINKKEAKHYKNEMLNDTSAYTTMPISIRDNKILTHVSVGGKKLIFLVDTGAETNIIDGRLSENVLDHVTVTRKIKLNGAGVTKVDALYGDMSNFHIGGKSFKTVPVLITNMEKMCYAYDKCLDGMLGFDFLSKQKIGFNFVTQKMYIWK
jgi:predicted aspartyl protease